MRLAIHYIYWQHDLKCTSYVPYVKKARELGFDAMEMGDYLILRLSDSELQDLRDVSKEYDIELTMGIDPPQETALTAFEENVRNKGIQFYTDLMPRLNRLGVKCLGGNMLNGAPVLPYKSNREKELELGADSLRRISRCAADYGISVNLEVTNRFENHLINLAQDGVKFAGMVDEPNFGLLLDTFHMNIEEKEIGAAIRTTGSLLGHFHLGENNRDLPGRGHLDWTEITDALKDIGYRGIMTMEPLVHSECELGDCCRVWNDLTGFADEEKLDEEARKAAEFMRAFG